jgi:hypothetical protein
MSFLRKRHGSDFDCLNPSLSYITLNLRNQFCDGCIGPYKFRLSFNAHSLFLCSKLAGNRRHMSSFHFACGKACVNSMFLPSWLCIAMSVFNMRNVLHFSKGAKDYV